MKTRAIHPITLLITLAGCCTNWADIGTFSTSSLAAQIRDYERASREHCIRREGRGLFISAVADHERESATAMIELLKHPVAGFPPEDAIDVLEGVYSRGIDLRDPETLRLLSSIEATPIGSSARGPRTRYGGCVLMLPVSCSRQKLTATPSISPIPRRDEPAMHHLEGSPVGSVSRRLRQEVISTWAIRVLGGGPLRRLSIRLRKERKWSWLG
jgi:hypothetical protein